MTNTHSNDAVDSRPATRCVDVLLEFGHHPALSAAQISRNTAIPVSAVYRHLGTLIDAGLVSATATRGLYSAGPETLPLSKHFHRQVTAEGHVTAHLQFLSEQTQELAAYLVVSGGRALCVDAVEGPHLLRCSYAPGRSHPLVRGASALALLSFIAEPDRTAILEMHDLSEAEQSKVREEVATVVDRGYAVSCNAVDAGVWGVSVPILSRTGTLIGAVSTMAPASRINNRESRIIRATQETAQSISQNERK